MIRCIVCHRPMKHATPSGMGKVCAGKRAALPEIVVDLFGYDIAAAEQQACERVQQLVTLRVWETHAWRVAAFRALRAGVAG